MPAVIDSDQHLYEYRGMWREHIDPALRDEALEFTDDARGHTWLTWRGRVLGVADVQDPGETDAIGERRRRERSGLPPLRSYDEALPRDYWEPAARVAKLAAPGALRESARLEPLVRDRAGGGPRRAAPRDASASRRPRLAARRARGGGA